MTKINLIAAVDANFGLGNNNQLLCHLPADLRFFKETTLGKPIIMGRKTFESIGRPLPGRQNIVLTRKELVIEGIQTVQSFQDALKLVHSSPEVFVIGGESVFREALSLSEHVYLTKIHHTFEADVFFPELDSNVWHCFESKFRPSDEKNIFDITFCQFKRN